MIKTDIALVLAAGERNGKNWHSIGESLRSWLPF